MTTAFKHPTPPEGWISAYDYAARHGVSVGRVRDNVTAGRIEGGKFTADGRVKIYVHPLATLPTRREPRGVVLPEEYDFMRWWGMSHDAAVDRLADAYGLSRVTVRDHLYNAARRTAA